MDVSTILIILADTDAGYRLTQLARRSDLEVTAVIRRRADPAALRDLGPTIIAADPTDRSEVAEIFADLDPKGLAVVSLLGGTPGLNSQGNINVIDAARSGSSRRLETDGYKDIGNA